MPERDTPAHTEDFEFETQAATWWLASDDDRLTKARGLVARAGNFFDGGDALREMVDTGNPLADEEPSIYAALLTYALAGIDWEAVAEQLAPDAWYVGGEGDNEGDLQEGGAV